MEETSCIKPEERRKAEKRLLAPLRCWHPHPRAQDCLPSAQGLRELRSSWTLAEEFVKLRHLALPQTSLRMSLPSAHTKSQSAVGICYI